jgi:hypothetical protein
MEVKRKSKIYSLNKKIKLIENIYMIVYISAIELITIRFGVEKNDFC